MEPAASPSLDVCPQEIGGYYWVRTFYGPHRGTELNVPGAAMSEWGFGDVWSVWEYEQNEHGPCLFPFSPAKKKVTCPMIYL